MPKGRHQSNHLLAYGLYSNVISQIKHFDNLQTYFRGLASSFSLGAFAAFGFLLSGNNHVEPFSAALPIVVVMMIGLLTVMAMWDLDLVFYERLQSSNLAEAIRLEKAHPWLPQIHSESLYRYHHDKAGSVLYFYVGSVGALIGTCAIIVCYQMRTWEMRGIAVGVAIALFALAYGWMVKMTAKTRQQVDLLVGDEQSVRK